jgi:hypothetical protein
MWRKEKNMGQAAPTLDEWRDLYEAAKLFKELAPWQWMVDADVFGIEDPESGEIGYSCIMGALGEVLGLVVYLGSEGLSLFQEIQSGKISPENEDIHLRQKCLALIFDDREMLDKEDLDLIKALGLKFRGRRSWPCFRSHRPGYVPWFLSGTEARYLSLALRYTMLIAEKIIENRDLLKSHRKGEYRVAFVAREGGKAVWREKWSKPVPYQRKAAAAMVDELRMARIKGHTEQVGDAWEVDFFFAPLMIDEGERPFFPFIALYAVHKTYHILNFCLARESESSEKFAQNFVEMLEKLKLLPSAIMVRNEATYGFFKPMTDKLGISLKKVKNLAAIEDAKESFIRHLGQGL